MNIIEAAQALKEGKRVQVENDPYYVYYKDHFNCLAEIGNQAGLVISIEDLLSEKWTVLSE